MNCLGGHLSWKLGDYCAIVCVRPAIMEIAIYPELSQIYSDEQTAKSRRGEKLGCVEVYNL